MNKYLIDSSSLISLVRYYDPFDEDKRLMNFVRYNFEKNNWLLHYSVRNEIKKVAERIVVTTYPFLKNKIKPLKMVTEITSTQHQNIDNYWAIHSRKEKLELRSKENYLREKTRRLKEQIFN